jgi:importin-5
MSTKNRKTATNAEPVELFLTLQTPQKIAIRTKLLECLQLEQVEVVRHKISDAVAEIARQYSDDGLFSGHFFFEKARLIRIV